MANYLATGEGPALNKRLELHALRSDGTEFPVELAVSRIPFSGTADVHWIHSRHYGAETIRG